MSAGALWEQARGGYQRCLENPPLLVENYVFSQVARAVIGLVPARVHAIAVEVTGEDSVVVHLATEGPDLEADEFAADLIGELDVLFEGKVSAELAETVIDPSLEGWAGREHRLVTRRRYT